MPRGTELSGLREPVRREAMVQDPDHVDLATWLREHGAMPADAAVSMVSQIAETLDALHAVGEVHGVVTASAIALAGLDGPRVDPSTLRASLTQERVAPSTSDRRSDVAALGRVLENALTASPTGPKPATLAGLDEVTTRATSDDPARRYERAADLAAAARAALEQPADPSRPTGGANDTFVRPIDAAVGADPPPAEAPAPAAGTLIRPLAPTSDPATTLDRPLAPTADARGTLHRPIETAGGAPEANDSAAAPGWTSTRMAAQPAQRSWRPLGIAALVLVSVLVAALAVWSLLPSSSGLEVQGSSVVPATGRNQSCEAAVDLVGTIRTNGQAGSVTYTWMRSDGSVTSPRTESLGEGQASVDVHLIWNITGKGRFPATATLRVLEPTPSDARADFVYDCR